MLRKYVAAHLYLKKYEVQIKNSVLIIAIIIFSVLPKKILILTQF